MSLHIGRLSPQVRIEDLERLFQRFGRCTVRLKDGYGFAIYDANYDAAQAMRALRGKIVCGERITLNWSNKQPRNAQGVRSSRFFETYHGRTFRKGENNFRFKGSISQGGHPVDHSQRHSPDVPDKKVNEIDENMKDAVYDIGEVPIEIKRDEGGVSDANAIETDRWCETGNGNLAFSGGDGDDFDRYEPYHGYGRQEETEKLNKANSYDSYDHRYSSENLREHSTEHLHRNLGKPRAPPTCYNCGHTGHIVRNCPHEVRGGKFKQWRDELSFREKWEIRLKRFGSASWRRPEYNIDSVIQTHHRNRYVREAFSERTMRAPRVGNLSTDSRRRQVHAREDSPQDSKKARKKSRSGSRGSSLSSGPYSRHLHPDLHLRRSRSSGTNSGSRSVSSHTRLRSCSRSHAPSHSAYSSSKSPSPSTRSKGSRSRSRSNINFPLSLLVSVSPGHKSPPAAEKKEPDAFVNSSLVVNEDYRTSSGSKHLADTKQEVKCSMLNNDVAVTSSKMGAISNGESLVPSNGAEYPGQTPGYTQTNLGKNLVDDDDVANGIQGKETNFEDTSPRKSNQEILTKTERSSALKLTSNEVASALKHYGIEAPEVDLLDQSVEEYFGAARLWPWEIIYYRRLKKGPISTENYSRRLEQNKEHGIVDQYVRSSSGWWECH